MSEKILVPTLGESITEATVARWLKNQGDYVEADEPIIELETDKVNLEVPSPIDGVLANINAKDGEVVKVGSTLGIIDENNSKKDQPTIKKIVPVKKEENNIVKLDQNKKKELEKVFDNDEDKINSNEEPLVLDQEPLVLSNETEEEPVVEKNKKENLSPAVRKIISENNINVNEVQGSGKDGRILKEDLINMMGVNPKPSERKIKYGEEERIKMTRLRQTRAKILK